MAAHPEGLPLDVAWSLADLDAFSFWMRYMGLGGSYTYDAFLAAVHEGLLRPDIQHDVAAHVLNEELQTAGFGRPVTYLRTGSA